VEVKDIALQLFSAAVSAVAPERVIPESLRGMRFEGDIRLLSVGKAGASSARAAMPVIGDRVKQGLVISPEETSISGLTCIQGSHPVPGPGSLAAGKAALRLASSIQEGDTLLVLLSGGASSLMVHPAEGMSLEQVAELYQMLLASGLDIGRVNTVRRHICQVKGGRLALAAARGRGVALAAFSTDGMDGPTDAAGAFVDGRTCEGMDPGPYLANNDSYSFLEKTGNLLKTGPTGTHVADVVILLSGLSEPG